MATKHDIRLLLDAIPNDEPLYLLRGSDRSAPGLVRFHAAAAAARGASEAFVEEANATAAAMEQFPRRKWPG